MNLAVKNRGAQPKNNSRALLESAESHLQAATRITDVDEMRSFTMKDLNEVRVNLYLALELLDLAKKQNQ